MEEQGTFVYEKRDAKKELTKSGYSINETCEILQLSPVWVRRMIKQNKLAASKKDGKWLIKKSAIRAKLEFLSDKDDRMESRSKGETTINYQVPSLKSCDIIERRVKEDAALTDEARELFLSRIDEYRAFFTARLNTIREERDSS